MASSTSSDAAAKVYTCPTCSREFNKKANLKVHSRKHTGEKPYACSRPGCDRRFMWKSSVTFHEQNCLTGSRDDAGSPSVPKRHKMIHSGRTPRDDSMPTTPGESPPRSQVTNVQNPAAMPPPAASIAGAHFFNTGVDYMRQASQTALGLTNANLHQHLMRMGSVPLQSQAMSSMHIPSPGIAHFNAGHYSIPNLAGPNPSNGSVRPPSVVRSNALGMSQSPTIFANTASLDRALELSQKPYDAVPQPVMQPTGHPQSQLVSDSKPLLPPSHPTEANPLPAPSTIFHKPVTLSTSGRPPVIPPPLQKPFFGLKQTGGGTEQIAVNVKSEVTIQPSGARPPVMHGSKPSFKMPISMELDESDDEAAERTFGAQENFMRTGNILGFAPQTRCSPLPASSPIVCPGISPMPLSPLAPFSPLPPDSPAHNAPNPVHPPLNQPQRSMNANF